MIELRPTLLGALAAAAVSSCAAASPPATESPAPGGAVRARPSERAMSRSIDRVRDDVIRCLRPGDRVVVRGAFRGADGHYVVERIETSAGGSLPYAVETCTRVAAEHAHVRPFRDERVEYAPGFETAAAASVASPGGSDGGVATTNTGFTPSTATGSMTIAARPAPIELIRREADALQRCYEQACERDHTVAGSVELHVVLDAEGRITRLSSRVNSPHEDITLMELVARCIESHVRLIQFGPQAVAGQETVVPLTFQPGGIPID